MRANWRRMGTIGYREQAMGWKERRYFTAAPGGHNAPLPVLNELPGGVKARLALAAAALVLVAAGVAVGWRLKPEAADEVQGNLAHSRAEVVACQQKVRQLQGDRAPIDGAGGGHLPAAQRARQTQYAHAYAAALKRSGAQGAADLIEWFVRRWNTLLDAPQAEDRVGRRAAALSLLIGGMAANVNPGDYVPWQEEFFAGQWLAEVHFDLDGDGLPATRRAANPHDGFASVSVCQVAMALNLSMTDARVFIMPELRCDRVDARMSVFLQGRTLDDALDEFVRAVRDMGLLAIDKVDKGRRMVLVGARHSTAPP